MSEYPWSELGIAQTRDESEIRRAYADKLRELDLEKEISAYASLRGARDEALWLARQDGNDEGDYGLGSLDDDLPDGGGAGTDDGLGDSEVNGLTPSADNFDPEDDFEWSIDASLPPELDVAFDAFGGTNEDYRGFGEQEPLSEDQLAAQAAWDGLCGVLLPDGQYTEDAVSLEQMDDGQAHLQVLLKRADESDLAEHDAIDTSLAYLMAEAWPRSAPFVEPANEALHWLDEAGQLEERPPLMFLNARLKGMRFHEKVQQTDHPLNKAWVELSRPGPARLRDRMRVKRLEVEQLLEGIRIRYPELESYLDAERVASWQKEPDGAGPSVVRYLFIAFVIFQALRFCANMDDRSPDLSDAGPIVMTPMSQEDVNTAVQSLFGDRYIMGDVRTADIIFADQLRNAINMNDQIGTPLKPFMRRKVIESLEVAEFDELVAAAKLRRLWLAAALEQGSEVCREVRSGRFRRSDDFKQPNFELNEADAAEERKLFAQLLDAGILNHRGTPGPVEFNVPGWMVEEVIRRSGLSEDQVIAALRDAQSSDRCQVDIAMLDIMMAQPGRVPVELLKLP